MEDKAKIKTTPSIYQQPLEDNRKIKTALTTNNQLRQNKNKNNTNKYLLIAIRKQQKIKTALTTNNQWKTKQKQKQHQQVFSNSHQKITEK